MKGKFKITLAHNRKRSFRPKPGEAGEYGNWGYIVDYLAKQGVERVENVRHDDKEANPRNEKEFTAKEMLELWKNVEKKQKSN